MSTPIPLFTSDREKRHWFWALVVIVAIYATLGPARMLADMLRERNLLRLFFVLLLLLVIGTIAPVIIEKQYHETTSLTKPLTVH
jgi:predicted membrane channel-forming protein YqfA (hemolysin III family)